MKRKTLKRALSRRSGRMGWEGEGGGAGEGSGKPVLKSKGPCCEGTVLPSAPLHHDEDLQTRQNFFARAAADFGDLSRRERRFFELRGCLGMWWN